MPTLLPELMAAVPSGVVLPSVQYGRAMAAPFWRRVLLGGVASRDPAWLAAMLASPMGAGCQGSRWWWLSGGGGCVVALVRLALRTQSDWVEGAEALVDDPLRLGRVCGGYGRCPNLTWAEVMSRVSGGFISAHVMQL
jgi:hypothetical protein